MAHNSAPGTFRYLAFGLASLLVMSSLAALGCSTTIYHRPGVSAVDDGSFQRYYSATPPAVLDAALDAFLEFDLQIAGRDNSSATARLDGGGIVTVSVRGEGVQTRTRVLITPGADRSLSLALLDAIEYYLHEE
ncbi:MAG: hypothetical protein D8M59_16590 [Planctomycetes bacterium]|nr:hypothetical protein [Planctomycetota bacterium]